MSQSSFETFRDKMKRQLATNYDAPRQTSEQMKASLRWCRQYRYELQFFAAGPWTGGMAVLLTQRIEALERALGIGEGEAV